MELVSMIEIGGEEREIADAYAREQIATNTQNIATNAEEIAGLNNNLSQLEIDLKMLGYTVPKEISVQNYVDSDGVFHQRVGRVDLGSLEWSYGNLIGWGHTLPCFSLPNNGFAAFKQSGGIFCTKYNVYGAWTIFNNGIDKAICNNAKAGLEKDLVIRDSDYTDATTFKTAMQGVYLYYELAEEKTISVDGNEAVTKLNGDVAELKKELSDSLPIGTILTVVDSATMSSDMWKLLKTGTLSYQDGGALVEISTITYQKIK